MLSGTILKERYQVEKVVGHGGFATTYRGKDLQNGDVVAVKECRNIQPRELERIRREARILGELSGSKGIVHIRDYIESDDAAYIIMDYADGVTLKAYVEQNGALQADRAVDLLKPVMDSVQNIHSKGLLHRDISPDNIVLGPQGTLKLLDFGAARSVVAEDDQKTMTMVLKPGYAPEEQYRSQEAQGTWTDVYALCATLYFCITGTAPIDSLQRMYEDTLKTPTEMGFVVSRHLEKVLMHGLELRSENRIASMEELIQELLTSEGGVLGSEKTVLAPEHADDGKSQNRIRSAEQNTSQSTIKTGRRQRKKTPKAVPVGILVAVFLCIVGIFIYRNGEDESSELDDMYPYISDVVITQEDIKRFQKTEELESISFDTCEISDEIMEQLAGLEQIHSLSFEDCYGYTSYEMLAESQNLERLDVSVCDEEAKVFDGEAAFPGEFPYVQSLQLRVNGFASGTDFLVRFPNLDSLYLYNSRSYDDYVFTISDIAFVKGLEKLQTIHISDMLIASDDISALGTCKEISGIELNDVGITNLEGLEQCTQLYNLEASTNQITSLAPLAQCESLNYLDVSENCIDSLEGLENANRLRNLYAAGNQISSLAPLRGKTDITILDLSDNQLQSLEGCEGLIDLDQINVNYNQISDLDGIANSTSLTVLQARKNMLDSIDLLNDRFTELETLDVAENQLTDIQAVSACTKLQIFRTDENQLTSLHGLENKPELYAVSACQNQLTDISALQGMQTMQYVDLAKNQIVDITPLGAMTANDLVVFLEDNQIADINVLPKENTYRFLSLHGNPLSDYEAASRFLVETLYLPDVTEGDYQVLKSAHMNTLYMVDVELGRQAELKREFEDEDFYMDLLSNEEAEENMQSMREFQRSL